MKIPSITMNKSQKIWNMLYEKSIINVYGNVKTPFKVGSKSTKQIFNEKNKKDVKTIKKFIQGLKKFSAVKKEIHPEE